MEAWPNDPCPSCGRGPVTSAKVLGYEDELWCRDCGTFFEWGGIIEEPTEGGER